jgi:hypothetical protein
MDVVGRLHKISGEEISIYDIVRSSMDTGGKCEGAPLEPGEEVSYTEETCLIS